MPCPLCSIEFEVPRIGGLEDLPNNYFIEKMIAKKGGKSSIEPIERSMCDNCTSPQKPLAEACVP